MSRLHRIADWPALAQNGHFCTKVIASSRGVADSSVRRFFAKEYGVTPLKCFRLYRLIKAVDLLRTTNLTLKEIAPLCGYPGVPLLCRHFKGLFGVPTSQAEKIDPELLANLRAEAAKFSALVEKSLADARFG